MKKKIILVVTIFILIIVVFSVKNSIVNTTAKQAEEESQDILYQDVIITALSPTINTAIENYYKNILTETPLYDSSFIKILNIERPNGYRTWYFIINIEINPFIGPHIPVGKDRISIELSSPGLQEILTFEHVKDYPLPERYQHLYLH
ncbi:hypothetical protein GCM10023142_37190 [Anaerocolumna aminovalerica]|jgi:hypothetical protein|uniref:DUF3888 domain-containing protein n=1 Tax=Anaerocolumna aminovalerica TaxID=1527 RepID=A0A1I5CVF0_9FIRM|nr:DUF3888 domain-containing protein [Anaerocolumna aminovalerica]MBU5332160.1 DUF3888 domain-containing protein [Anaerocolumna aminovalerica]SFN90907.1 Protein of unknown function [Anaerocolumna aminovalerica]